MKLTKSECTSLTGSLHNLLEGKISLGKLKITHSDCAVVTS